MTTTDGATTTDGVTGTPIEKPLVIVAPYPQRREVIFTEDAWDRLTSAYEVVELVGEVDAHQELRARFEAALPRALAIVGQPDLPEPRLAAAGSLRAILNVEGNFFPNVDYAAAFSRGIRVLGCGPAYAQPVAEFALGLLLDLARGITRGDRDFRAGREGYTSDGNQGAILVRGSDIGLIGMGNLGRALLPLLRPFAPRLRVYDPWLPDAVLRELDVEPVALDELLRHSRFVVLLAASTSENTHLLDADTLAMIPDGGRLVLVSRAAAIDIDALLAEVSSGRLTAAVDVWPEEPVPAEHPARSLEGLTLSAHRAGGIEQAFHTIGEMVLDDLALIAAGLPPARMQQAAPELVGRYRNKPVVKD